MIIDPKSNVPIYRQIMAEIRSAIAAGVHRPGEALPSLRALSARIRVNPNTIQRAYEGLEREGVIETRRGVGVFVVDHGETTPHGVAEQRVASGFRRAIETGLGKGVPPARIRTLFEAELHDAVVGASG